MALNRLLILFKTKLELVKKHDKIYQSRLLDEIYRLFGLGVQNTFLKSYNLN